MGETRSLKKSKCRPKCHAELVSASNKINELRDPERVQGDRKGIFQGSRNPKKDIGIQKNKKLLSISRFR
jgi:hypothetical protein